MSRRLVQLTPRLWAVHDSEKPYGARCRFFTSRPEAEAYRTKGQVT